MIYQPHNISAQFIQALFQSLTFQTCFQKQLEEYIDINPESKLQKWPQSPHKVPEVVNKLFEQITTGLVESFKLSVDTQCHQVYKANLHLINEIQIIKTEINNLKSQNEGSTATKQKSLIPFMEVSFDQQPNHFNVVRIHKDIQQIQSKLNQLSFMNSFTDDLQVKDEGIEEKIDASIQQKLVKVQSYIDEKLSAIQKQWNKKNQLTNKTLQNLINLVNQIHLTDNSHKKGPQRSIANLFGFK